MRATRIAAGTDETGNGRLNLANALTDDRTDEIQPAGASPIGSGGPFVGPYVAGSLSGYQEGTTFVGTFVAPGVVGCGTPGNALTADNLRATCLNDGEGVLGSGFGLQALVPSTATGISFSVAIEAQLSNDDFTDDFDVALSWNGDAVTPTFTTTTNSGSVELEPGESANDSAVFAPSTGACSTFGRTWSWSELADTKFLVRLVQDADTASEDMSIDDIDVRVCYDGAGVTAASIAGALSAVASPSATLAAAVEVEHHGPDDDWECTTYQVEGQGVVHVNTSDETSAGTDSATFNLAAPAVRGTYDVSFVAYTGDTGGGATPCNGVASASFVLVDAITVGLFGDSFGILEDPDDNLANNTPSWADSDGTGSDATTRERTGIITSNAYLRLRSNNIATRTAITTTALGQIHLSYMWGQEDNDSGADTGSLVVQWRLSPTIPNPSPAWVTLATHTLTNNVDADPVTSQDWYLGTTAKGTSIEIRFQGVSNDDDLRSLVDSVLVDSVDHTPGALTIDKSAPASVAHGGTVTYTFDVSYAPGTDGSAAQDIVVSDPQCTSAIGGPDTSTGVGSR